MKLFVPTAPKKYVLETKPGKCVPGNAYHRLWVRRPGESDWHCVKMYPTEELAYKGAILRHARAEHFLVLPSIIDPNNPLHFMVLN